MPLRRLFSSITGGSWGSDPEDGEIVVPCIRGTDFDYGALRTNESRGPLRGFRQSEFRLRAARRGDLLIEKSGGGDQQPVGRVVLHDSDRVVVPTNFAGRLRTTPNVDPRFCCYLMASLYSDGRTRASIKQTTGIQNLDLDSLLSHRVLVPSTENQRVIADYLDAETVRIDALIEKKRRMVELMNERLSILIELLTWTIPNPSLVSLGKLLQCRITDGPHESPEYVDEGFPFLSIEAMVGGHLDFRGCRYISEADHLAYSRKCSPIRGDVLLAKTGATIGKVAVVESDRRFSIWSPLALLRPRRDAMLSKYLWYCLQSRPLQDQIRNRATQSTQPNIAMPDIAALRIVERTRDQQRRIVALLDEHEQRRKTLATALAHQIDLATEHRNALITAAVTGQLDLPGVAA